MSDWPLLTSIIVPPHSEGFGVGATLPSASYLERMVRFLAAAERIGAVGAFVYDFPAAMDPWLVAFDVLNESVALQPVVAVRPHQEAAESVSRRVADLTGRFGRPAHVNVVAGATRSARAPGEAQDPVAARRLLGDYARDIRAGIDGRLGPRGERPLIVTPSSRTPGTVVPADCVLMMARPREQLGADIARVRAEQGAERIAMLVGFVVRDTRAEAWAATTRLYPADRRQVIAGRMFVSQVVSSEHTGSYALAEQSDVHDGHLWYGAPNRGIDAPKLVGSVADAAAWLRSCRELGVTDLIIDLVPDPAEYDRIGDVLHATG
ncbi:hypothetical protein [Symbioplanes lichenis]|uniref:hypothetical protein n=1 Tax=Symbioplanes lichenis TaxID=1629072 RepID=UPI0027383621|nr:hypothetical protein [Actinoplanes lichenis]